MKNKYSVLIGVLGVVLGFLLALNINFVRNYGQRVRYNADYSKWQKLNFILNQIENHYVDTVDFHKVTDNAIDAVLHSLDPHSVYLPPAKLSEAEKELSGKFYGIGIQFNVPNDTAIVLESVPGGPAQKAGILRGDRIIKVDGKNIAGIKFPQDSMMFYMKGEKDSNVNITILRDNSQMEFPIKRGEIPNHSVEVSYMINDTTGYIKLSKFSETTFEEMEKSMSELSKIGMKRLLFDLRGNTGGYFNHALLLANMFLPQGADIVYLKGHNREREAFKSDGKGKYINLPISVLVDENSASSSEIFAGAIQDNDRGLIIGRRTFGKGLVQEPIYFTDGSGIRLTVARFYTPSGRCIQKPYTDTYEYDIYRRYEDGEMYFRDSIKVDTTETYKTSTGRVVYGGGGIIPDVYVPMDTTTLSSFHIKCSKTSSILRYSSYIFDKYKNRLSNINSYVELERFFAYLDIENDFKAFIKQRSNIVATEKEWKMSKKYIIPQIKGLIARSTGLGEVAFYRMYEPIDKTLQKAIETKNYKILIEQ